MAAVGGFPSYRNDKVLYAHGVSWEPSLSVEFHPVDGFTVWGWTHDEHYVHHRFVGYTVAEGRRLFRRMLVDGHWNV